VDSVNTIDNLLDHIENHLKDDIKRLFHNRYINKEESRIFLQKNMLFGSKVQISIY